MSKGRMKEKGGRGLEVAEEIPTVVAEVVGGDGGRVEALRGAGLTREKLYRVVSEGLEAVETVLDRNGQVINTVPAYSTRAKFAPLAVEILGEKAKVEEGRRVPNIVVILPTGARL